MSKRNGVDWVGIILLCGPFFIFGLMLLCYTLIAIFSPESLKYIIK